DNWSSVTASRATLPARRRASTFTRMPILIRAVRAATAAMTTTGSATYHSGSHHSWWSHTKKPSQPCSSAATARFSSREGSPNEPTFGTPIAYRGFAAMIVTLGPGGPAIGAGAAVIASLPAGPPGYAAGMLPTGHLLAFALLSFMLIIVPGPNVIFVITRSLMLGRAAGVSTAVGGQIGVYTQVTAVALGIG